MDHSKLQSYISYKLFTMNYEPFAINQITVPSAKTDTCNPLADQKFL